MAEDVVDLTQLPILDARSLLTRQGIHPKLSDWRTLIGLNDEFFDAMVRDPFYRYVESIQLAPASEADHHAGLGGLLAHTYDVITLGLKRRRGLQLPHGGSIEQINEQRHLWTYAVFAAGLMHDIGKLMAGIRLKLRLKKGIYYHWTPHDRPLREIKDAVSYQVEFVKTPYAYHTQVALTLFDYLPTTGRAWLAREPQIMGQLCAFLRGDRNESGVIGEILESADMTSTAQSQKRPAQQRFSKSPSTIERLVHWVRNWIVEGELKLNRNGAMGWVDSEGHLFIVCRSLADKIIHYCDAMGITDIPRDPIRLYDVFQDYGFALPTPDGKAIWNMLIECNDYKHALTCLKFEARRFTVPTRPLKAFDGVVKPYGGPKQKPEARQKLALSEAEESANRMQQQIRDTLLKLGGSVNSVQAPEAHHEAVLNQEAALNKDAETNWEAESCFTQESAESQENAPIIGGAVMDTPKYEAHLAAVMAQKSEAPPEAGQDAENDMPWGEPDDTCTVDQAAASKISPEADTFSEAAQDQETAFSLEAVENNFSIHQEAAEPIEDEPVFLDHIETSEPIFLNQVVDDTTVTQPSKLPLELAPATATDKQLIAAEVDLEKAEERHKKFSRYTISGIPSFEPGMVTIDAPDIARMFLSWLRINMLNKTLQMNCPEALVHIMEDCVLLLAPGIFKNFLQIHAVGSPKDIEKNHKKLSEKFARLRINIKTDTQPSINIHKVYAVGKNRAGKLSGWKIPLNVIYSDPTTIPKPNRFLKATPDI